MIAEGRRDRGLPHPRVCLHPRVSCGACPHETLRCNETLGWAGRLTRRFGPRDRYRRGVPAKNVDWGDDERQLTDTVSVLVGPGNGAYPSGNSLLVRGAGETLIIDPSVTVVERGGAPVPVDAVVNSHAHEDHVAANGFFADARVH